MEHRAQVVATRASGKGRYTLWVLRALSTTYLGTARSRDVSHGCAKFEAQQPVVRGLLGTDAKVRADKNERQQPFIESTDGNELGTRLTRSLVS